MPRQRSLQRLCFCGFVVVAALVLTGRIASAAPPAMSYELMDYDSRIVVLERNSEDRCYPASLTKIMTALLVLEHAPLRATVTVSPVATKQSGALLGLKAGDTLTVEDALKAMLLESDNDAAVAAAEHAAGTVEQFVEWMNARAAEIGATHTHFVNPTGAHDPRHFTTAHDLALIAREALANSTLASLVALRTATVKWSGNPKGKAVTNRNKMLWTCQGCQGMKTGSTPEAGDCVAAVATRNGWRLLCTVLGAKDAQAQAIRLFAQGFGQYKRVQVLEEGKARAEAPVKGGSAATVPVAPSKSFWLVMPKSVEPGIAVQTDTPTLQAPVEKGAHAGRVTVLVHDKPRATIPLVAAQAVPASRWRWTRLLKAPVAALALFALTYWALVWTRRRESPAHQ